MNSHTLPMNAQIKTSQTANNIHTVTGRILSCATCTPYMPANKTSTAKKTKMSFRRKPIALADQCSGQDRNNRGYDFQGLILFERIVMNTKDIATESAPPIMYRWIGKGRSILCPNPWARTLGRAKKAMASKKIALRILGIHAQAPDF